MLNENQQYELLKTYPALRSLPSRWWQAVVCEGQSLSLPDGSLVFDEGSACLSYVMVTSGSMRVVRSADSGRELVLYRVLPGDNCVLTISCLLGDCAYQARGVVEAGLTAVSIARPMFLKLVAQSPEFRTHIFRSFGERLMRLLKLVDIVAFHRLDQRLAALLLLNGPVIVTTHQNLADELGSVREVISRILEEFQSQNIVRLDRGQVQVLDDKALRRRAYIDK